MKVAVLGASGTVGRRVVDQALRRGLEVTGQTRAAARLAAMADRIRVMQFDPLHADEMGTFVRGQDAVVFALGVDRAGATSMFSDTTSLLIAEMQRYGVRRLVAITGVGAGDTRGHGGFFYDRFVFPLFTWHRYADKDRQEALIAATALDWIIVRPAVFVAHDLAGPLQVHTRISRQTILRRVTCDEVASFVVDALVDDTYLRQTPFIGHP